MLEWQLIIFSGCISNESDIKQLVRVSCTFKQLVLDNLIYIENITDIKNYIQCKKLAIIKSFHKTSNIINNYSLVELFQNCTRIKYIDLSNHPFITDAEINVIADHCNNLVHINLSGCNLLTESLVNLSKNCKKISRVFLSQLTIDKKYILQFIQNCNKLVHLELEKTLFIYLKNEIISEISIRSNKLCWLNLSCTHVSDDNVLDILKQTTRLNSLKLENCFNITDKLFINGSKYMENLLILNIKKCGKLTNKSFENNLIKYCKKLQCINMEQCWRIRSHIIQQLTIANPNLQKINITGCIVSNNLIYNLLRCKNIQIIEYF